MLISELKNKRILIYGAGREGLSAIRLISDRLPDAKLYLFDDKADWSQLDVVANGLVTPVTATQPDAETSSASPFLHTQLDHTQFDVIIKSPGVSYYNDFFRVALKNNITVTSGTNLFLADVLSKTPRPKLIGITGTKGKSTTSSLVYHFLTALGKRVAFAGNIGTPLLDLFGQVDDYDYIVCEVSSFQATDLAYPFDVALLNNLHSEHLDWHLTEENYQKDKANIFLINDSRAYCSGRPVAVPRSEHPAKQTPVALLNYLDANTKKFVQHIKNISFFNIDSALHVKNGDVYDADKIIAHKENIPLLGNHNLYNIVASVSVLKALGEDLNVVDKSISSFKPLKHRLEIVCEKEGITFVNDSIATTPIASVSALDLFKDRQVTILVGGHDRGLDFTDFVQYLANSTNVKIVCLPVTGKRIYQDLHPRAAKRIFLATCMAEAVKKAKEITPKGGVVLLSPGAPSFNAYKDYEERGEDFRKNI